MSLFELVEKTVFSQSVDEIIYNNLKHFYGYDEDADVAFETLRIQYEQECFNELNEKLAYFRENILDIQNNFLHYKAVYERLSDQISKETYERMMAAKVFMNMDYVQQAFQEEVIYFSRNIFDFSEETYVDCGGFDGDTVLNFTEHINAIKHMYVFEAMQKPAEVCRTRIKQKGLLEKTTIFQKAVYNAECILNFDLGVGNGDSSISQKGNIQVEAVRLDDCINDCVTFLKMDIEGSEKEALYGAERIIKENTPKMAICIYHLKDDFWKIPELILSINPHYKFKVRQHDPATLSETVLYCIPDIMGKPKGDDFYFSKESKDLISYKKDKIWFLRQIRSKNTELEKVQEIENSKEWLSGQYENLKKRVQELELWNHELEVGKDWLSQQNTNLNNRVKELEDWIQILECEKERLAEMVKGLEK